MKCGSTHGFFQGGCHMLAWTCCQEAVLKLSSPFSFEKWDQFFFDLAQWWWLEVTPFLAYLAKLGQKWITTQKTLKKSIHHKRRNKILFPPLQVGIPFGTCTIH